MNKISFVISKYLDNSISYSDITEGRVYIKHVLSYGNWVNPNNPNEFLNIDKKLCSDIVKNFDNKTYGQKIAIPLSHDNYTTENAGVVKKVWLEDDGLWAELLILENDVSQKIDNGTIFDVSIEFLPEYIDRQTGEPVGAVMSHIALVNNPYIKNLKDFKVMEYAFSENAKNINLLFKKSLSEKTMKPITNERDIDVTVTYTLEGEEVTKEIKAGETLEVPEEVSDLVAEQIKTYEVKSEEKEEEESAGKEEETKKEKTEEAKETEGESKEEEEETEEEAKETEESNVGLSEAERKELEELRKEKHLQKFSETFNALQKQGKVVNAQKDAFMKLADIKNQTISLNDEQVNILDLFKGILEKSPKLVSFNEEGTSGKSEGLPKEELDKAKKMGFDVETYKKFNQDN